MAARIFVVLTLVWAAGCTKTKFGEAIGRPPQSPLRPTNTSGVRILEVDLASGLVKVTPPADGVDVTTLAFQSSASDTTQALTDTPCTDGSGCLEETLPAGFLSQQSGELAVVAADGTMESYIAWGADPTGSPLFQRALLTGVQTAPVSVPIPVPPGTVITPDGCENCAPQSGPIALNEVHPGNGGASYVELQNTGAAPVDLSGVRVCNNGQCEAIANGTTIAAGALLEIPVVREILGDSETVIAEPGTEVIQFPLAYMRTVDASDTYEHLATSAGVPWAPASAPPGDYVPGESLSRNPGTQTWFPAHATPGTANPVIDRATNWQSCVEPAQVEPAPSVVASSIDRAAGTIVLENTTASPIAHTAVHLFVDGNQVPTNDDLAAGASVSVPAIVNDAGSLNIVVDAGNGQFLQWGNVAAGVNAAVAASLWPASNCVLPPIDNAVVLRSLELARGSGGYAAATP